MTYLKRLREWEAEQWAQNADAYYDCFRECGNWRCEAGLVWAVTAIFPHDIVTVKVEATGRTREEACKNCYLEAVKRGLIEPKEE